MSSLKKYSRFIMLIMSALLIFSNLSAEVRLPKVLASNMVLQRNQEVKIWGWADSRERVSVIFNGQRLKTSTGKDGKWMVYLDPMSAGGPYQMIIQGKNTIVLKNIMIGDVWLCSGQSNMAFPVSGVNFADQEIANANYPDIRLFTVPKKVELREKEDISGGEWEECSSLTIPRFSAVAYFFGRELYMNTEVPIGLINSSWGGTNVETWTSREMAMTVPEMEEGVLGIDEMDINAIEEEAIRKKEDLLAYLGTLEVGMIDGVPVWAEEELDLSAWKEMELPSLWEEKGLDAVDGVVWFRRTFQLSKKEAESGIKLHLGPVDDSDKTWINGTQIGKTMNDYKAFRVYSASTDILHEGENVLVVRVEDYGGGGGIHGEPEAMRILTSQSVISLAGTWKFRVSSNSFVINPNAAIHPNSKPTLLYNGMISPLTNFQLKGAIWYQGEQNTSDPISYRTRFPNMIQDWRAKWESELGFYFVQLANFMSPVPEPAESDWAELREAQTLALDLPQTGMAVIIDIGDADDIHPKNKQDVGFRLAQSALHGSYGKDIVYRGPQYKNLTVEGNKIILSFDLEQSSLLIEDKYGYVKGFAIAGEDNVFYWAQGIMKEGNKIVLSSEKVEHPMRVRYAWADNPDDANVYNEEGFPLGPFRASEN